MAEKKLLLEVDPMLGDPSQSFDKVLHYVERLTPKGIEPPVYSKIAICGARVEQLYLEHTANVCQGCIDESRRRHVER